MYLCHFPVAWGFLGWVALVPLLCLVRAPARTRRLYWTAYLSGLCFYLPVVQWMRVADERMYVTWIILSFYCALYFPLALFLVRQLDRRSRLPLALTLPVVWVVLDYFRANFPFYCVVDGGFPWYLLGYGQFRFLTLIQIADVTGVHGVTFLVAAVNALVFEWLYRVPALRRLIGLPAPAEGGVQPGRAPALAFQSALALLAFAACLAYGSWRLGQGHFEPGPRVALLQTNVPQQIRNDPAKEAREKAAGAVFSNGKNLHPLAVARRPELIVWPETSWGLGEWDEVPPELAEGRLTSDQREIVAMAVAARTYLLLGLNANVWTDDKHHTRYNSAQLVGPDGKPAGRYSKIHRVPFGEYIPLKGTFMDKLAPYDFDYSIDSGEGQPRLPLGKYRFGVVICYEDTDHRLARGYVNPAKGDKVDFVINISNDGWFDGTSEHEEHLAICRFRAIECRRSVARSVNMGISAVIDGNGRVLAPEVVGEADGAKLWKVGPDAPELPVGRWHEFKKVPGVLFATIPLDDRSSFYARWGDWLVALCGVVLVVSLIVVRVSRPSTLAAR
jgi:apolipoprotein N-acyltransferase